MNITQRLKINENNTRSIGKDSAITREKINKIGNLSEEIKQDVKEYQNLTEMRLNDLENQTRVYHAVNDRRLDNLVNKTKVYDALISNLTDRIYSAGSLCVCVCLVCVCVCLVCDDWNAFNVANLMTNQTCLGFLISGI